MVRRARSARRVGVTRGGKDPTAFAARTIRRALYLPLLIVAVFAGVVLCQVLRLRSSMAEVERASRAISRASQAFGLIADAESSLRGYGLTHERAFLDRVNDAYAKVPGIVDDLERSSKGHPLAIETARELRAGSNAWYAYEQRTRALVDAGADLRSEQAWDRAVMDHLREQAEVRLGELQNERDAREASARVSVETTLAAVAVFAVVLAGAITLYVRRDLVAVAHAYAQALDEVARSRDDAEESSRIKDEFLGTISHELRTPLNAILGWSAMLSRKPDDPETRRRALETIDRNARSQARLIDDMLDVSRVVSGHLRLRVAPFDLGQAVTGATRSLDTALRAKHVRLELSLDPHAGTVSGDVERVRQVVFNLVGNAVKFTPAGGHVRVSTRRLDEGVEIRVADSGPGIPRDVLPHVFELFRQGDASPSRRHGGIGLGLAVVRHLVELHGGSVRAECPGDEGGSTFVVVLPLPSSPAPEPPRDAVPPPLGLQPVTR
jgi:signal transduction histidine kinase